jgi:hypothetical protein
MIVYILMIDILSVTCTTMLVYKYDKCHVNCHIIVYILLNNIVNATSVCKGLIIKGIILSQSSLENSSCKILLKKL